MVVVVKVAATFLAVVSEREQEGFAPLQAPLQLLKVCPLAGVAVSVTELPLAKLAVQVPLLQFRPAGVLVMVPLPLLIVTANGTVVEVVTGVIRT